VRHILRAFQENATKLGIPSVWLTDAPGQMGALREGDTVLAINVTAHHLAYMPGVDYCLHNFDANESELCRRLEATPERLLRLQVYTDAATGEAWGPCRRFDLSARTLFQPWGSDLLVEEFMAPVFNPESRQVPFVGAIWSDQYEGTELGNEAVVREVKEACRVHGLAFRHLTQVTDAENIAAVRAGRVSAAFAGAWQVANNYFPCRVAKAAAYGALPLTNVPVVLDALGGAALYGSPGDVVEQALGLERSRYLMLVREAQRGMAEFTYRESLVAIERAFAEIAA
jgi:hypothetical protein